VNFGGGSLEGANLIGADMTGVFGIADISTANLGNATCPDGTSADENNCSMQLASLDLQTPPPLAAPLFLAGSSVQIVITPHTSSMYYMGVHEYIPGVSSATMSSSLIIGEASWQSLVGPDAVANYTSSVWIVNVDGVSGDSLEALASTLSADFRVSSVLDWSSSHKSVERDGGLIFGTPGLLSLQFVVASIAAVASSFVFLSLVLSQRQKELAVLQAIGASPNQIIRLVLFEILSIVMVSMALGIVLGIGVALSFNGFFDIFGFIFQIFGGSSTSIERTLVYPWYQLLLVSLSVFAAVVIALLVTTRKSLKSDLASVLKGE
jgi:ABC-type antimicrobial peptide transport system permease subunit